jgi:hypothetical protein
MHGIDIGLAAHLRKGSQVMDMNEPAGIVPVPATHVGRTDKTAGAVLRDARRAQIGISFVPIDDNGSHCALGLGAAGSSFFGKWKVMRLKPSEQFGGGLDFWPQGPNPSEIVLLSCGEHGPPLIFAVLEAVWVRG